MQAVSEGVIQPHERDMFDAADFVVGPSVYTVTDQFIKPVTAAAGKMSWGLFKNAAGLKCNWLQHKYSDLWEIVILRLGFRVGGFLHS